MFTNFICEIGKCSQKRFVVGEKYDLFLRTKVSKDFQTPKAHKGSNAFFFIVSQKEVDQGNSKDSSETVGKDFIRT